MRFMVLIAPIFFFLETYILHKNDRYLQQQSVIVKEKKAKVYLSIYLGFFRVLCNEFSILITYLLKFHLGISGQ